MKKWLIFWEGKGKKSATMISLISPSIKSGKYFLLDSYSRSLKKYILKKYLLEIFPQFEKQQTHAKIEESQKFSNYNFTLLMNNR
jgi:hypothetical protein